MLSADFPTLSAPSSPSCVVDVISPTTYCGPAPPRPKAPLSGADSPYQGEMSRRDKRGRDAVSRRLTERLLQIWYDLSVSAFRRATSPERGGFGFSHRHGFPYEGKLSPQATDEVDNVSSTQLSPPHPSRLPPCHLPLIGEGFSFPTSPHAKIPRRLHPKIKKSPSHPGGRT